MTDKISCDQAWELYKDREEDWHDVLPKEIFRAGWEANKSELVVLLAASKELVDWLTDSGEIVDRMGHLEKLSDLLDRHGL